MLMLGYSESSRKFRIAGASDVSMIQALSEHPGAQPVTLHCLTHGQD